MPPDNRQLLSLCIKSTAQHLSQKQKGSNVFLRIYLKPLRLPFTNRTKEEKVGRISGADRLSLFNFMASFYTQREERLSFYENINKAIQRDMRVSK